MTLSTKPPILLVEDNPTFQEITQRALTKVKCDNPLYYCDDGEDALDFVFHRGRYETPSTAPRPGIILLDLNLPGTDGREVLQIIKNDEDRRTIPVIVLTTSSDDRDIELAYQAGANSYIVKPMEFTDFCKSIQQLKDYWFDTVVLPNDVP